jgi:hypothetical protein
MLDGAFGNELLGTNVLGFCVYNYLYKVEVPRALRKLYNSTCINDKSLYCLPNHFCISRAT